MKYKLKNGVEKIQLNSSNNYLKDKKYTDKDLKGEEQEGINKYFDVIEEDKGGK